MRIAFYHKVSRTWDGTTADLEPLGGTQTAIIGLTRALAALGHDVLVFGTPQQAMTCDGVAYCPASSLPTVLRQAPVDVLVSVVNTELFGLGLKVPMHLFWSHNDYRHFAEGELGDQHATLADQLARRCDKVIGVSEWHAEHLRRLFHLPTDHVWATKNGIDPQRLPARDPGLPGPTLVYTSAPDRGLDVLLRCFPAIRAAVPAASLVVSGSFQTWGMPERWTAERESALRQLAEQPAVTWVPAMSKPDLFALLGRARVLAYPSHGSPATHFLAETSCLAAIESQAMGVPVVSSRTGALAETVAEGRAGTLIDGPVESEVFADAFIGAVVHLLRDDRRWQQQSDAARERMHRDYTWQTIAGDWVTAITQWQAAAPTTISTPPIVPRFPRPTVTVLIPTYNRADNLRHCLTSLCTQTHPAFEVLICDDGSTDNTFAVVHAFTDRLNLRYLHQPHLGFRAGAARNMGLRETRGKYTVLLDSDMIVPSTFLAAHVAALDAEEKVGVNSYVYRTEGPRDVTGVPFEHLGTVLADLLVLDHRDRFNLFERQDAVEESYFLDSNAISFKTKDLITLQGFDESFVGWGHEDTDLGYRMGALGFKLRFLKEGALAYHLHHPLVDNKEAEQKVNWDRMRAKWRLATFYVPLGNLPVELAAYRSDAPDAPIGARMELKTGQSLRFLSPYVQLDVEAGVLQAIRWLKPGESVMPDCRLERPGESVE